MWKVQVVYLSESITILYYMMFRSIKWCVLCFCLFACGSCTTSERTYDIVVYGGTSGGVIAAYSASRLGKSVLLVEPGRHLGGLSSGGLGQTDIGNKQAITGLSRDFYRRMGRHYGVEEQWTFEPHVAEEIFNVYIERGAVEVLFEHRIISVLKEETRLQSIMLEHSTYPVERPHRTIQASVFLDTSYEGDLMARAGVSYMVGRESNDQYGETYNGVQLMDGHQFPDGIDPYKTPGDPDSGLLWGISAEALEPDGTADEKVQAYNFRICLTRDPANLSPITRPDDYDSTRYELLLRLMDATPWENLNSGFIWSRMPNNKTDINNRNGFSTDMIGYSHDYPEADYTRRANIIRAHESYTKGLLYFVGHDRRVPDLIRAEMQEWGYPKDEYVDNGHFSHQLYIREARRMIGEYVMTEANCVGDLIVEDPIGLAAYTMDSHNTQRIVVEKGGVMMVKNEGNVEVGGFPPYPISYRSLTPKRDEVTNLLVPVALSASHIAYGSIRMEPVFMVLGQSAAIAAVLAVESDVAVQDVPVEAIQRVLQDDPLLEGTR